MITKVSDTFVEIDHKIFFYGYSPLLGWCQLQQKYVHEVQVYHLVMLAAWKSVVRLTDHLDMMIVVDWDVKQQNQTKP